MFTLIYTWTLLNLNVSGNRYSCVNKLISNHKIRTIVFASDTISEDFQHFHNVTYYTVNAKGNLNVFTNFKYNEAYILKTDDITIIEMFYETLYRSKYFNSNAKYIILYSGNDDSIEYIFKVTWKFYLTNVLLINENLDIYTYFPITEGMCRNTKPRIISNCKLNNFFECFNESQSLYFRNCELRIFARAIPTYVDAAPFETNQGFEIKILRKIVHHLQMKPIFKLIYGDLELTKNRKEDDLYEVINNDCDLDVGFHGTLTHPNISIELTYFHAFAHFTFIAPVAKPIPSWKNLLYIFKTEIWISLVTSVILLSIIWKFFSTYENDDLNNSLFIFSLLLTSVSYQPTTKSLQIIYTTIIFCFLLLTSAYQSLLTSFLFTPAYEYQISTLTDLLESGMRFGGFSMMKPYLNNSDDKVIQEMYKKYMICNTCSSNSLSNLNFSILTDSRIIDYSVSTKSMDPVVKLGPYYVNFITMYLKNGSPFKTRINELIVRLYENGLNSKWDTYRTPQKRQQHINGFVVLELQHLKTPFYTYGIVSDKLKENLQLQLSELEMLQSMFSKPGELKFDDVSIMTTLENFLNAETTPPSFIDFTVNLLIEDIKFELGINLSNDYPDVEPDVYIRNSSLKKQQHAAINQDCNEYIKNSLEKGEICVYNIISWLQENGCKYIHRIEEEVEETRSEELTRLWIYSHHIYNKTKRREILNLANTLKLTGFCLPGKPGIICVEGAAIDCNQWWQTIKSMNWQRIFCKLTEECKHPDTFVKFNKFEELSFQCTGNRNNHMDLGELYKYLDLHNLGFIFKELFGFDGK